MKAVCISLDFELRWGVRHLYRDDFSKYKVELDGAKSAAVLLCDYFEEKQIASSWATVGALGLRNWDEFFAKMGRDDLNTRSNFLARDDEFLKKNEKYYFAPEIVEHLCSSSYVELASHTFTHLFCCEPHMSEEIFLADGKLVNEVFRSNFGREVRSIVFPRNQENYTNKLTTLGITSYRAVEAGDSAASNTLAGNTLIKKLFRFSSSVNPWASRSSSFNKDYSRASLFLRLNLSSVAWRLHLSRIKNELNTLLDGECFHLWLHPHNLGSDTNMKLKRIKEVMNIILEHRDNGQVEIVSMEQLYELTQNLQMSSR